MRQGCAANIGLKGAGRWLILPMWAILPDGARNSRALAKDNYIPWVASTGHADESMAHAKYVLAGYHRVLALAYCREAPPSSLQVCLLDISGQGGYGQITGLWTIWLLGMSVCQTC